MTYKHPTIIFELINSPSNFKEGGLKETLTHPSKMVKHLFVCSEIVKVIKLHLLGRELQLKSSLCAKKMASLETETYSFLLKSGSC